MMKRLAMGLTVFAVLALMGADAMAQTPPRMVRLRGFLHGGNETPPVSPASSAFGWITCDANVNTEVIDCRVNFWNVPGAITASHFHAGVTGANGPVVCDATPQTPVQASNDGSYQWQCNATTMRANAAAGIRSMQDLMQAAVSGMLYFNVHTAEFGGGQIRGNVCPDNPEANFLTGVALCGGQARPPQ